jgi:NAD(P)-dependent dehydrogenase (short-subunit alcohol dehydrogenase family)
MELSSSSLNDPLILVTGASSGLGLSIARRLIARNHRLILTARKDSLSRFEKVGIVETDRLHIRALDVTLESDRKALFEEINDPKNSFGGIDVVVNNAGFTYRSVLEHVEQEELLKQMVTNFWGPMELIRAALPEMRRKRKGQIINISSVGGMMAMPTMAVYSASKFALEGASESLYYEVKPWNISVTLVEPGFINSDSFDNVRYTTLSGLSMRDPSEAYFGHYRFMTAFIGKLMTMSLSTPDHIAKKIEKLIGKKNPPLRSLATIDAFIFDLLRRWLPRRIYHFFLYRTLPYPDCWGDPDRLRVRCQLRRDKFK